MNDRLTKRNTTACGVNMFDFVSTDANGHRDFLGLKYDFLKLGNSQKVNPK